MPVRDVPIHRCKPVPDARAAMVAAVFTSDDTRNISLHEKASGFFTVALAGKLRYRLMVLEKKRNWFSSLSVRKRTNRAMRFFYVRLFQFVFNGRR